MLFFYCLVLFLLSYVGLFSLRFTRVSQEIRKNVNGVEISTPFALFTVLISILYIGSGALTILSGLHYIYSLCS